MFDLHKAAGAEQEFINSTWDKLDAKLSVTAVRSRGKIPYTSVNGVHTDHSGKLIDSWTNGFWPGQMWLMYYGTGKEDYRTTAELTEEMLDAALFNHDVLHHDVGFMWLLSSGANYKITGNKQSRNRALFAADVLAARFNMAGKFIRAWNGEDKTGYSIIDCMMNIPLLYWAARECKDERYRFLAMAHADTTMENHIRPDGSVKHIVVYDPMTGEYLENLAGQGYRVDSSWSRGQAWALYGFILSYIHTGKQEYLDTAKRVAHYFIACVCDDYLPKSDFRSPEEPVIYDSTAGAIAACGLLEIARNVSEYEGQMYFRAAINILKALEAHFCNYSLEEDSILQMGSSRYRELGKPGMHAPLIFGDYYFTEAIYKLKGYDILFE